MKGIFCLNLIPPQDEIRKEIFVKNNDIFFEKVTDCANGACFGFFCDFDDVGGSEWLFT